MEHHLRPPAREGLAQVAQVLDVADQPHQRQLREAFAQVLLDAVQVELAQFVQHQPRRLEARHLAAQLAADAAAGAGDQHRLAAQRGADAGFVQLHRLAAEQVLGLDVAHALVAALRVGQLGGAGHGQHRQAGGRGQLQRAAALRRRGRGHGDHQVRGRAAHLRVAHRVQRAQHLHAGNARMLLGRVVVEQAEHGPALLVDAGQQPLGGIAGAQHQRAADLGAAAGDARARVFVEHAVGDAHHAHAHQRDHRVQRQHRARHLAQAQRHDHRRAGHAGQRAGQRQPLDLAEAGKAPHALRHAEQRKGRQVGRHHAEQHPGVVGRPRRDPALEAQPEQVGDVPAGGDHQRIGHQRQRLAVRAQPRQEQVEPMPDAGRRLVGAASAMAFSARSAAAACAAARRGPSAGWPAPHSRRHIAACAAG